MEDIVVDFDEAKGRFIISSPPWRVNLMRNLPSRRWEKSRRLWSAPAVARNVEYIRTVLMGAKVTAAAKDAIIMVEQNKLQSQPREPFPSSYPFKQQPYPKQLDALNMAYSVPHFALLMAMRTGKTKVCVDLYSQRFIEGLINCAVITCPKSIRKNWEEQIGDNCPVPHSVWLFQPGMTKTQRKEYEKWAFAMTDTMRWLVFSTESLSQGKAIDDIRKFLMVHRAAMAVDESSRIKNSESERTKKTIELGRAAKFRNILTGSVISQSVMDAYSQFEFLDPQIIGIGDYFSFRNRYAVMGGYGNKEIIGYQNIEELMANIKPYSYMVSITDAYPGLPEKIGPITRTVAMTHEQIELYRQIRRERSYKVDTMDVASELENTLEISLRQQQVAGGFVSTSSDHPYLKNKKGLPVRVVTYHKVPGRNPKMDELMEVLTELQGPVIIWARYAPEIKAIVETIGATYGKDQVAQYWGEIDEDTRENERVMFQHGVKRFFVGNQQTGGMGIDLSAAQTVIYFSNTFSLIDREQSEERPYGPKIKHPVLYIDIVCEKSLDVHVLQSIREKRDFSEYVKQAIREGRIDDVLDGG